MLKPSHREPVILVLQGGLGNQLYQWAFGTALRAAGVRLYVDPARCRGNRPLAIEPLIHEWPRVPRVIGVPLAGLTRYRRTVNFPVRLCREEANGATATTCGVRGSGPADLLPPPGRSRRPAYLLGYFQSPRYFAAVRQRVIAEATSFLTSQLTTRGRARYQEWSDSQDSVAIHVRRGDYLSDPAAAAAHGVMPLEYYASARTLLDERGLRRVAWFSDDLDWVARELARPDDTVVDGAGLTTGDGGEIALMSACRVRVVANSSFSWWAGYLGRPSTPQRPVIAPRQWYRDGRDAGDRLLPQWVTR